MKRLILLTFLFNAIIANSQNNKVIDWGADLDFIKVELPKNHFNFYTQKSEKDFFNGLEGIAFEKDKLSDFGISVKLQQLVASFGDSHTEVRFQSLIDVNKILPLGLFWFSDGIFVIQTTAENKTILGYKILGVNGIPIKVVIDSLSTLLTIDNNAIIKNSFPQIMPCVQFLECFGITKSTNIELQLENPKGESYNYIIKPAVMNRSNMVKVTPNSSPMCYQNTRAYFIDYNLKKDNVYYIQYNTCYSRETPPPSFRGRIENLPSFDEFYKKVIDTINGNNFGKIIFDMRFNGGGSSPQGTKLISELSTMKNVNQKGKLYVILGRKTFSSAIINAMDFKNLTQAIFVGEETGGKPNHFGEVKFFDLPSSGIKVQYSTKYFGQNSKAMNTITPDYIIEPSFKDYQEGHDPVYEWILKH